MGFFLVLLMSLRGVFFVLFAVLAVFSGSVHADEAIDEGGVHGLYDRASVLFEKKKYKDAIAILNKIEALYPFSQVAIDGSLMSAEANYELGNYREAATLVEGYIGIYPNSPVIDYAYYIRIASKYMLVPDLGLDDSIAKEVLEYAAEFVKMFPESEYLAPVQEKLGHLRNHVAAKEFLTGRFYMKRGEYIAAIKRFSTLVREYPDSAYFQEGMYRLSEAYSAIGDKDTASVYSNMLAGPEA